jgi:hypothetical protein
MSDLVSLERAVYGRQRDAAAALRQVAVALAAGGLVVDRGRDDTAALHAPRRRLHRRHARPEARARP